MSGGGEEIFLVFVRLFAYVIGLLVLPFVLISHAIRMSRRKAAMQAIAKTLGLRYEERQSANLARSHNFLSRAQLGNNRYALNTMRGTWDNRSVIVFDLHSQGESVWWWAPSRHDHNYLSFVILNLERHFPELIIKGEAWSIFSRFFDTFDGGDIDFESHEFSKRFDVRCKNKKFAYDFCNAQMIEYLLEEPRIPIELEQNVIAIGFEPFVKTKHIEMHLEHLVQIRARMPQYLFNK